MDVPLIDAEAQYALSALESSPYDSDAYNTADARIHFGPLTSPEKKFVSTVARSSNLHAHTVNSSLRRSPRLSSPHPMLSLRAAIIVSTEAGGVSDEIRDKGSRSIDLSRLGTPDNELVLPDEPSSVLASRIIRAQDNPSPPPKGLEFIATDDTSLSVSPTPPFECSPHPQLFDSDNFGLSSGSLTPDDHGHSVEYSTATTATPDLISFDSLSASEDGFRSSIIELGITVQPDDIPSVDDLFTRSPSPLPLRTDVSLAIPLVAASSSENGGADGSKVRFEMTPESLDERSVIHSLFHDVDELLAGSPQLGTHCSPEAVPPQESSPAETHVGAPVRSGSCQGAYDIAPLIEKGEATLSNVLADDTGMRRISEEGRQLGVPIEADIMNNLEVTLSQDDKDKKQPIIDELTRERTPRKRDREALKTPTQAEYRILGSLSPTSTNLLTQLLPSQGSTQTFEARTYGNVEEQVFSSSPQLLPIPTGSISPVRFSSPVRGNPQKASDKPRLQPVALDDPSRTPARRIAIDEAVTQGYISPQKAVRLADVGRAPTFNIRPNDSPARRVNIAETPLPSSPKKWQGIRFGSPTRSVSRQRSASTEPQGPVFSKGRNQDRTRSSQQPLPSKDMSFSQSQTVSSSSTMPSATHRPAKLPFPIISSRTHFPNVTDDESEHGARMSSPIKHQEVSSSIKSGLKQTTSKIPRGVKPYARPLLSRPTDKEISKPALLRTVEQPKAGNSTRTLPKPTDIRVDVVSGSISNEKPESVPAIPSTTTVSSTLKRKRMPEKASPVRKSRPVVLLRQVPKVAGPPPQSTDVKKAVQPIRRVVDRQPEPLPVQVLPRGTDQSSHLEEGGILKVIPEDTAPVVTPTSSLISHNSLSPLPSAVKLSEEPSTSDNRRRTTRPRKPVRPVSSDDVFGGSELRSAPSRRKGNVQPLRSDGTFSSMTAVALKALTSSNTIKNQKYLAAKLETKVIRKEGTRPESPAVKIRTISQRMQDEKAKQRKERATRRAKRGDEGSSGMEQTEMDEESDSGESSDWDDQNSSPNFKKHKRGPGEQEDYETPVRSERQAKRPRVREEGEEALREGRRVKWDRCLFTTIYVDEVKVGTRPAPKGDLVTKGCLAPTAKAAPLDNMGNLPETDTSLGGLVEENVEVKKFVYDNDVEPLSPVIMVKNTRLRSKRAKS
ncbi:hypothetical protein BDZ94DRAFT_1215867 [Collybia nuda]|uniref:Uncharacterized protein n=1 Tax=Collybia nuda TaxID=64659 RepID=A0A9P6CL96_9AGAR|nr:hypothetical protein BDZ94DRAFT_1215867 [Collybia nuda]